MLNLMVDIYTIGVYGQTEESFFHTLRDNNITLFLDLRNRRGMRGGQYAFVNSKYLQLKLQEMGIQYSHAKYLAPTKELRQIQKDADKAANIKKHQRVIMTDTFRKFYQKTLLTSEIVSQLVSEIIQENSISNSNNIEGKKSICLFCVEKNPLACHRPLIAEALQLELGIQVCHL